MAAADQDKYILRFPDGMRDKLKSLASGNGRSLNAEIIARLEQTLEDDGTLDDHEKRIEILESKMADVFYDRGWEDYPGNDR